MSFMRRLLGRKMDEPGEAKEQAQNLPKAEEAQPADALRSETEQSSGQGGEGEQPQADETSARLASQESPAQVDPFQPDHDLLDLEKGTFWRDPPVQELVSEERKERGHQPQPHTEPLRVGYASDVGQVRGHNEDTLIAFQGVHLGHDASGPLGFFVVTDGMGGHQAGEVASALAARQVTCQAIKDIYLSYLLDKSPSADQVPLTEVLKNAVEKANSLVSEKVPGGGTTLTCALVMGRRAYIAHVGDSRAYLLTDRDMRRLTQDHSFVNRLIELGELSPEEAAVHPHRHVLYKAVGQGDSLDVDTYQQPLPPGSRLLLCSDGLSGMVPEKEIGNIIAAAATPQEACQRLVEAANEAGGVDNITAILVEVPSA